MVEQQKAAKMNDAFTIQIKCADGSAACGSQADEVKRVETPGKMLVPVIASRMKEPHYLARAGIKGMRFIGLGTVAALTGQSKVICGACAASTFRSDMLNGMQLGRAEFRAETIFAISQRAAPDQSSQLG